MFPVGNFFYQTGANLAEGAFRVATTPVRVPYNWARNKYLTLNQQQQRQIDDVNESGALSTGAIIGIVAGGVCLVGICIAGVCLLMRSQKNGDGQANEMSQMGGP